MLFLLGLGIMLAGIVTAVVVARKGVNRSGDLMGDAMLGAASAIDDFGTGFSNGFGRGQTTSQSINNGFSAMFKSMLKSQLKMAKKNWKLFLARLLAYLAIVFGIGCMIIWVIHFLWTLFFRPSAPPRRPLPTRGVAGFSVL